MTVLRVGGDRFFFCLIIGFLIAGNANAGPFDSLAPGHWYEIPNSRMSSVDPCPSGNCSYSGNTKQSAVIDAWNSGVLDTKRSRLIVWGGGHHDYGGNEVYAFDLAAQKWAVIVPPSASVQEDVCYYSDGRPAARHTNGGLQYSAVLDALVSVTGSSTWGSGNTGCKSDALLLSTLTWKKLAASPWSNPLERGTTAVDPSTGLIYSVGDFYDTAVYNPAADQWVEVDQQCGVGLGVTLDVDPTRRLMVTAGRLPGAGHCGQGSGVKAWDLTNIQAGGSFKSTSGDKAVEGTKAPGFSFDPVSRKFVAWIGGAHVYTLDPANWTWQKVNAASGNTVTPTAPNANGTYGRFRYVPAHNVFVLVNRTSDNVFVYRLSAGTGSGGSGTTTPVPVVSMSASPATISSGGSTTLSWTSQNASSCTASGGWVGTRATSGQQTISSLSASSTFTLTCSGNGGSASGSAAVTVQASGGSTGGTGTSGGGTTGGTTGGTSGGTSGSTDANADWQKRSTGPGVVLALGFDTQSEWLDHIWEDTNCDPAYAPGCKPNAWDQSQKASGAGSVRFDIKSKSHANIAGSMAVNFSSNLQTQFGENDEFWVQWRQRFDDVFINHPYAATGYDGTTNWKQIIIGEGDRYNSNGSVLTANSCTQLELVMQRRFNDSVRYPGMYMTCGEYLPFSTDLGYDYNYTWQNERKRSDGRSSCTIYEGRTYSDVSGCTRYVANEWMTFMVHVKLGPYGSAYSKLHDTTRTGYTQSTVEFYAARQGGALELAHREDNLVIPNSTRDAKYGKVWLLPFMTNKDESEAHADASTWYDELIVSRQPIPAPAGASSGGGSGTPSTPSPSVTLSASPTTVSSGGSSTLSWSAQNASSCSASGGWSGGKALSGQQSVGPLNSTTTFTLSCGGVARSVTVTVQSTSGGGGGTTVNQPPAKPAVQTPAGAVSPDGAEIDTANAYSDPENNPLGSAEWQISRDQSFSQTVLKKLLSNGTSLKLAAGALDLSSSYWVRTRHRDSLGAVSAWSTPVPFSTIAKLAGDGDGDGIVDAYEVQGFADSNANGRADAEEGICNLLDAQAGNVVGLQADAGNMECYRSVSTADLTQPPPAGVQLPYGLFNFRIDGLPVNPVDPARVKVRVHLPQRPSGTVKWYKFDPATGNLFEIDGNVTFEGNTALFELVDGGAGDFDGVVNGVIVDPSGPVFSSTSGASTGGGSSAGGGGSSGLLLPCLLAGAGLARCLSQPPDTTPAPTTTCTQGSSREIARCKRAERRAARRSRS